MLWYWKFLNVSWPSSPLHEIMKCELIKSEFFWQLNLTNNEKFYTNSCKKPVGQQLPYNLGNILITELLRGNHNNYRTTAHRSTMSRKMRWVLYIFTIQSDFLWAEVSMYSWSWRWSKWRWLWRNFYYEINTTKK